MAIMSEQEKVLQEIADMRVRNVEAIVRNEVRVEMETIGCLCGEAIKIIEELLKRDDTTLHEDVQLEDTLNIIERIKKVAGGVCGL
jgi:hypothetical protein